MITHSSEILPRIGLGMAALGRPGYINLNRGAVIGSTPESRTVEAMKQRSDNVMTLAMSLLQPLPWFDCARSYGLSEKFVGEYLREHCVGTDDVYVSSKWGYTYVADWNVELEDDAPHEVKDHSVENFLKQIEESNEYIGEYIDLYQVHSATFESGILTDKRIHKALDQCRLEHGWKIGLSVSGSNQDEVLREAMKIQIANENGDRRRLFDSVQCTYNLLEQKPGPALQEAHDAGMDIIIKEGLANGRLLTDGKCQNRYRLLSGVASELGVSTDQLALAFILTQDFAPRVLSGAVTAEHLQSNHKAVELAGLLKKSHVDILARLADGCVMDSDIYWADRKALVWN